MQPLHCQTTMCTKHQPMSTVVQRYQITCSPAKDTQLTVWANHANRTGKLFLNDFRSSNFGFLKFNFMFKVETFPCPKTSMSQTTHEDYHRPIVTSSSSTYHWRPSLNGHNLETVTKMRSQLTREIRLECEDPSPIEAPERPENERHFLKLTRVAQSKKQTQTTSRQMNQTDWNLKSANFINLLICPL